MYLENKKNTEFKEFFEKFKKENSHKWASIVNASDIDLDTFRKETVDELADKYTMLKQFTHRKQIKEGIKAYDELADDVYNKEVNFLRGNDPFSLPDYRGIGRNKNTDIKDNDYVDDKRDYLEPNSQEGEIYDSRKFNLVFMEAGMICNISPLNRTYNRKVLMFCGNKEGMISYGVGLGPLYIDAWNRSFVELKKNLILIEWDPSHTFPKDINSRYHDYRFFLNSSFRPSWFADPIVILLIRYTGLYHCNFYTVSRKKKPYSMIFALFKMATNNTTKKLIAEGKGVKQKHLFSKRGLNSVDRFKQTERIKQKI